MVLFLKIDVEEDEDEDESDTESTGVLDLSKIREMRLVPSDPSQCEFLCSNLRANLNLVQCSFLFHTMISDAKQT